MHNFYAKKARNEIFGHFIEFGWFNWSDIAYTLVFLIVGGVGGL